MAMKKRVDTGNGEQFKFEEIGQELLGYYIGSFAFDGEYGPTLKHVFKTEKGLSVVFGQTHLTGLLEGLTPGVLTRVTLTGTKKVKKGNPMKVYELEYDEDDAIDVESVAASTNSSEESEPEYNEEESNEVEEPAAPPARTAPRASAAPAAARSTPPKSSVTPEQRSRAAALLSKRN